MFLIMLNTVSVVYLLECLKELIFVKKKQSNIFRDLEEHKQYECTNMD